MDATREIYWNVGHGVVVVMYLLTIAAVTGAAFGFKERLEIWRQGKPLDRFDRRGDRTRRMLATVFGQTRVFRVKDGGLFHSLFFWGFLTLLAGTMLIMVQADFLSPLFNVNLLQGNFYRYFSLVLDLAGLVAIVMLGGLFVRRFFIKPKGLETVTDDYRIHALLFTILITGFLIEGSRMAVTELKQNPDLALWSPVGYVLAQAFSSLGDAALLGLHKGLWWFHLLLGLGFIAVIPRTKLRHILTTSGNSFLAPFEPKGTIGTINLEDESIEQFGASKITDLTWKDLFDSDACTSCKRCQDRCPAYSTDKPLSPMKVIKAIGSVAETSPEKGLVEAVTADALWSCTTCGACQDICPANIEHVNKILELRRNLTLMEGEFPGDEVRTATNNIEVNGNPFGMAYASRGDWAKGLPVSIMQEQSDVDILYFAGCYASFDSRNREVAANFLRICAAAGVKVGILGKEEKCCGEPVRKLGNEYLYQTVAAENIETIKGYKVKRIVTTCPHCFNTLSRDYRDLKFDVPVEHYSTFINRLIVKKRLKLKPEAFEYTYHDSCYLGRYKDIFEEPRAVLKSAGGKLTEMSRSGYDSFCCGAGGGRIFAEEKLGSRINVKRVAMASETDMPILASNCPFCLTMFEDGIKTGGFEGKLKVRDLAEIVAERIEK
jgi:Fe-S oxidoreductase/nitrate reductase gamma subunit